MLDVLSGYVALAMNATLYQTEKDKPRYHGRQNETFIDKLDKCTLHMRQCFFNGFFSIDEDNESIHNMT